MRERKETHVPGEVSPRSEGGIKKKERQRTRDRKRERKERSTFVMHFHLPPHGCSDSLTFWSTSISSIQLTLLSLSLALFSFVRSVETTARVSVCFRAAREGEEEKRRRKRGKEKERTRGKRESKYKGLFAEAFVKESRRESNWGTEWS